MYSSAFSTYTHNSKRRLFLESNSSSSWELDVIKSEPESSDQISISTGADFEEMINVDMDEDCNNVVFVEDKIASTKKMKGLTDMSLSPRSALHSNLKATVDSAKKIDTIDKGKGILVEPDLSEESLTPESNELYDLDGYVSDDDFWALQAHFDNIDLPTGVEAPFPSLPDIVQMKKKTPVHQQNGIDQLSTSTCSPNYTGGPSSGWQYDPKITVKSEKMDLCALQAHFDNIDLPTGIEAPIPWLPDFVQMKKTTPVEPLVTSHAPFAASKSQPNGDESTFNFSIQGLILNSEPYFNEPGHEYSRGSARGERCSMEYNENTLILSLKTMVYTMNNRPPKDFEYLVVGHFCNHVRDILSVCKAYTEGVRVGCFVKGGVPNVVDKVNNKCSNSDKFKNNVVFYIKTLISAFKNIGAQEADEFLSISEKKVPLPASAPVPARYYGYSPFQFTLASGYYNQW